MGLRRLLTRRDHRCWRRQQAAVVAVGVMTGADHGGDGDANTAHWLALVTFRRPQDTELRLGRRPEASPLRVE